VSNSTLESWLPRSCRPEQDSCQCGAREGGERAEPGATTAAVGVTYWVTEFERVYLMTAARIRGKRALIQRDVPASTSRTAPRPSAWWDKAWIKQIVDTATALLFAGLAPALVMAALWRTTKIAPTVFAITFAIALGHAVFLGLPLFFSVKPMDQRHVVCHRCRPGRRPELACASSRASYERAGRWRADNLQQSHHSRWRGQLRQASDLFRVARGAQRIRLLGLSDIVRHLERSLPPD
jgi:hypothetical protein